MASKIDIIKISGVEYRVADTYNITQQAGNISSSTIDVLVEEGQDIPVTLQDVEILDNEGNPFFWGLIQNKVSPNFSTGAEVKRYRLSLVSGETIFNFRRASEAFENKYTHEIVQTLFDNYISEDGITLGEISVSDNFYITYNFQYTKLYDVLTELAEAINASFYISPDKKFYFVTRETFEKIPAPEHISDLQYDENNGDIRTVQIVTGASEETSAQTESTTWDTNQSSIILGYNVKSITGITINAIPVGVGILGVDEEDTSKTFLYQVGSNTITLNANATVKPSPGDIVVVIYSGFFDIVITNINDQLQQQIAALNGTSGKIENVFTDETIDNVTDADSKANSLLDQFSEREVEVSCLTHDLENSELLKTWIFNYPDLGIVGEFVICERDISDFGDMSLIRLKFKSKNFYKKYGTVFKDSTKEVRRDLKIYKQSSIGDTVNVTDEVSIESAGLVFWPTSGTFTDPEGFDDSFYPI